MIFEDNQSALPVIQWTRPKLDLFKKAHKRALALLGRNDTFMFDGHEFVVSYAGYLIEYLESKLAK